jgi:ribosomal protein S18 acetylase RimI-like enzyme
MLSRIFSLASRDPLEHTYTVYDIIYRPERTIVLAEPKAGDLEGYMLIYDALSGNGYLYVWRAKPSIITESCAYFEPFQNIVLQLSRGLNPYGYQDSLEKCGFTCSSNIYVDMIVEPGKLKPYTSKEIEIVELTEDWAERYAKLEASRRRISLEEARHILRELKCWGALLNGNLVGVTCVCARTVAAWAICNVYTHPAYRGKGIAKTLVSEVARRAHDIGAIAFLHVERGNRIAFRVYSKLGFRAVAARVWLFCRREA